MVYKEKTEGTMCPHCSHNLRIVERTEGLSIVCPECERPFQEVRKMNEELFKIRTFGDDDDWDDNDKDDDKDEESYDDDW